MDDLIREDDLAVLNQLRDHGADLGSPHLVWHYLYFPERAPAQKAADALIANGYEVEVRLGADDVNWLALASKKTVLSTAAVVQFRAEMENMVESLGGEYDGWETEV